MIDIVLISLKKEELQSLIRDAVREELGSNGIKNNSEKELLTVKEACTLLDCSRSYLNSLRKKNKIPSHGAGKRIYLFRSELIHSIKNQRYGD
jgi:excisionase family DNA binding protein